MCQIGMIAGYRLNSIRCELQFGLDCCDDWLQAGQYKV